MDNFFTIDVHHHKAGFTLVETLVAITVLVLAVAAPLTLGSQGLTASRVARDQVTATYLAQEAIEYIHNLRDTNVLSGRGWLTGLDECLLGTCRIALNDPEETISGCGKECPVLNYNDNPGIYGYAEGSAWVPTKFTRSITMEETVSGIEAEIEVTVSWTDGIHTRSIATKEYLLNWE
jgi:prepilin-type N-terminal cleavage/methylation domain-containing protein